MKMGERIPRVEGAESWNHPPAIMALVKGFGLGSR